MYTSLFPIFTRCWKEFNPNATFTGFGQQREPARYKLQMYEEQENSDACFCHAKTGHFHIEINALVCKENYLEQGVID